MHRRGWLFSGILVSAIFGSLLAVPLIAQQLPSRSGGIVDSTFAEVHFDRWITEGPTKQLPWNLEIDSPRLSSYQRIAAQVRLNISSREFLRRPGAGRLKAFVQITSQQGRVFQSHLSLDPDKQKNLAPDSEVQFYWGIFLLPGEYRLDIALADTTTGEHNFVQRTLRVKPLKQDPLPGAWNGLPEVEFFGTEGDFEKAYLPDVETALNLGIAAAHPVDLHILVNVAVPERASVFGLSPVSTSNADFMRSLGDLLPLVKILGQLHLARGTSGIELIDATRHRVVYAQNDFQTVDWHGMKTALGAVNPNIIDVKSLQQRGLSAAFVRDRVLALLHSSAAASAGRAQVVILLSHEMDFSRSAKLPPVTLPANCNCRIFYLRLRPVYLLGYRDDIGKSLNGLDPRIFSVNSSKSARKALAAIIAEISRM